MIDLFAEHHSDPKISNQECFQRVGELLRVLVHVSLPFRDSSAVSLVVEPEVQETFIAALEGKFKAIEYEILSNDSTFFLSSQRLVLLSRLLQFVLSFRSSWTQKSKEVCINLSTMLFPLTLVSSMNLVAIITD